MPRVLGQALFAMLSITVFLLRPNPAGAQDCRDCEVILPEIVRLGDREGPGALEGRRSFVQVDSRGRYFVTYSGATTILVFDSSGTFLSRIGRRGNGPGEFQRAFGLAISRQDSIFVFDNGTARLSVFDPQLSLARTTTCAPTPGYAVLALDRHRFVAALPVRTRTAVGYPLHLYDEDCTIIRSFGSLTRETGPGVQQSLSRVIARGATGTIWSGRVYRYEITQWDTGNILRRRIVRNVEWFPARTDERHAANDPPQPLLSALTETADGALWVALLVADRNWRDAIKADGSGLTSDSDYQDSVLELIDYSGNLLAHARVDGIVTAFLPGSRVVVSTEDDAGFPYVSIFQAPDRRPGDGK
jgi:hypothetical protein